MTADCAKKVVPLLALLLAVGCTSELEDPRFPTGSHIMVPSSDYKSLFVANSDAGVLNVLGLETGSNVEVAVGAEPTRLARAGKTLWATLREARSIVSLAESGDGLTVKSTIEVGAEPFGVVAAEDGSRIFVSVSLEDRVEERDGQTGELIRSWKIQDEPRWLALHPSGESLYVASARRGRLTRILLDDNKLETIRLPSIRVFGEFGQTTLSCRLTGDMAVVPDGSALAVPAFYVNNTDPVPSNSEVHSAVGSTFQENQVLAQGGYGSHRRMNPILIHIPTDSDGETADPIEAIDLTSGTVNSNGEFVTVGSYPTSVTASQKGNILAVTMEGSDAVTMVKRFPDENDGEFDLGNMLVGDLADAAGLDEFFDIEGFSFRAQRLVTTPAGPRGVSFVGYSQVFIYSFLDERVSRFDATQIRKELRGDFGNDEFHDFIEFGEESTRANPAFNLTNNILDPNIIAGRKLFYSAVDSRVSGPDASVSCASCHLGGRDDGLSWHFTDGARQTPSLAGDVSKTAPVTWHDDVQTVEEEVLLTSVGRMGGSGMGDYAATQVAEFIDWVRNADTRFKGESHSSVMRGKELFESEEVGCAECHYGEMLTDNEIYTINGKNIRTRSLIGISATAPYFHDGEFKSLHEVVEWARMGGMGNTAGLSESDTNALIAYLYSL